MHLSVAKTRGFAAWRQLCTKCHIPAQNHRRRAEFASENQQSWFGRQLRSDAIRLQSSEILADVFRFLLLACQRQRCPFRTCRPQPLCCHSPYDR
jgi:hypothetical protein